MTETGTETLTILGFGEWLNEWGSVDAYRDQSREWKNGYEQAIRDAYERFDAMFPQWASPARERVLPRTA